MNASEKSLWIQLLAAMLAILVVACLLPLLGDRAVGGFAIVAIGAVGGLVVARRGVVVDERDFAIQKSAVHGGLVVGVSILFFGTLLLAGDRLGLQEVPKSMLTWLLWIAGTAFLLAKGLIGVIAYRKDRRAAQS